MLDIEYRTETNAVPDIQKTLDEGVTAYNASVMNEERQMFFPLAYDGQELIGGARSFSVGDDFYIKILWVDELYRSNGVGRKLMMLVEKEAQVRNSRKIWVDTMSYQAPRFYEKCGYRESGRIGGFRDSHDRIFFCKELNNG